MTLAYGFAKSKVKAIAGLKSAGHRSEVQYHIHLTLALPTGDWDVAINVGTNDSDDLLKYKLALDFHHPITATLAAAAEGFNEALQIFNRDRQCGVPVAAQNRRNLVPKVDADSGITIRAEGQPVIDKRPSRADCCPPTVIPRDV